MDRSHASKYCNVLDGVTMEAPNRGLLESLLSNIYVLSAWTFEIKVVFDVKSPSTKETTNGKRERRNKG